MNHSEKHAPWMYRVIRVIIWSLMKIKFRARAYGMENVPREGGVILASNHASFLDPPLLGGPLTHRIVRFMARDTLYEQKFLAWFYHRLGVVPLSRERGDIGAIKVAIQLLKEGQCVALFPEGTRTIDGQLQPAKGGIGFLIAKAAVPVVPVYIKGTFDAFPKGAKKMKGHPISIYYGKPIQPSELLIANDKGKPDFEAIGNLVMQRIADLQPA